MFRKKKKKETAEELKAKLKDLEGEQEEDLDVLPEPPEEEALPEPPKPPKAVKKAEPEPKGEFSIDMEEMALFAQLAAGSEEYKIYQQGLAGQRLDKIITEYNKAVGEKQSEVPSSEDTDEELPSPE